MSTTAVNLPPTPVSQHQLDQMERMAGKASSVYQRLAEQRAEWVKWEQARDREEARLQAAREAKLAVAHTEQQQQRGGADRVAA